MELYIKKDKKSYLVIMSNAARRLVRARYGSLKTAIKYAKQYGAYYKPELNQL